MRPRLIILGGLFVLVVLSAIAAVYSKHQTRALFAKLQHLHSVRDDLQTQWGRLQLEQSTWTAHGRIQRLASQRLNMHLPSGQAVIVRP